MYQRHHQSSGASNASSPSSAPVRAMYDEKLRQLQQQVLRLQESDRQKAREIVSLQSEIKASKQEIPVRFDKAVVGNRADTAPKRPARLEPLQGIRRQGDLVKNNPSQPEEPLRVENRRPSAVEEKKARDKASPLTQHSRMKAVRVGEEEKALGERLRTQRKPVGSGITSSPVNSNPAQRSVPDYEAEYATSMGSSQGVTKERRYPVPKGTVPGDKDESALDSEPEPVQTNRCFVTISRENLTACAKTGIITERVAEKFWQFCLDRVSSEKNDLKIDCTALPEGATRKDSRDQNMDLNPHPPGCLTNGIIPHEAPLRRQAQ